MNLRHISLKLGILTTVAIGAALIGTFNSVAIGNPAGHYDQMQISPENMHDHMKARLDKLAARLEIKASQQAVWEDFEKSVEMLADRTVKKPNEKADAATIARYRADKATAFANNMTEIADATAKLQVALTEDQQKILNQVAQRFLVRSRKMNCHNEEHGSVCEKHGAGHEGQEHGWDQHGNLDTNKRHDVS